MKKFHLIISLLIVSFTTLFKAQAQGPSSIHWNSTFNNDDLTVVVDQNLGKVTFYIAIHYNNRGCQWWLEERSGHPLQIRVRESGQTWQTIATNDPSKGGNASSFVHTAGLNGSSAVRTDIDGGLETRSQLTMSFDNLDPKYLYGVVDFSVIGFWETTAAGCGGNIYATREALKVINLGPKPSVSNVTATQDKCGYVELNWTNPNNFSQRRTAVYRNGSAIGYLNSANDTRFTDHTAEPGVSYDYKVESQQHWVRNPTVVVSGSRISINGKAKDRPATPANVFIDQVNCNGALEPTWNWSTINPNRFVIERSNSSNFSNSTVFYTSGSDRAYRDGTAQVGQNYYWRISAEENCASPSSRTIESLKSAAEQQAGLGVPAAPSTVGLVVDTVGKRITVNWADNSSMEDGFKVVRQSSVGQIEFDVAENATSYVDNSAQTCETYTYSVKSYNTCKSTGVLSTGPTGSASAYIPADLGTVFDGTNQKIEATDGEFGDRVDLKWTTRNRQIDFWNILRINPRTNDTIPIATVNGRTSVYSDLTANANTLYTYLIQGETDCAGNTVLSNTATDNGFRLSFGTVNGQITYSGGVAVQGVKVSADPAGGNIGGSMNFVNVTSWPSRPFLRIAGDTALSASELTLQAYVKPENLVGENPIISRLGFSRSSGSFGAPTTYSPYGYSFYFDGNELKLRLGTQVFSATHADIVAGNWFSVAATIKSDTVKLFVNKSLVLAASKSQSLTPTSANNTDDILIGKHLEDGDPLNFTHPSFTGHMEEVRFYVRALSNKEIFQTNDIYINPASNGLRGYWRFDEGFGNIAYDYSKTNATPNKNHATLSGLANWSTDVPTATQLSAGAYTNQLGSYFIPFIPYAGSGDNFTLTPTFGVHQFSPASTTLLIGTGSTNYTGQNFTDISSFKVTGQVKYDSTSCFVKEARLLIDGEVVIKNGQIVQTDAQGQFEIQVPIGPHVVTVEKTSHDFSAGRFPSTGAFDFQAPVSGIEFIDNTLVKVVGRVAGGGIQKDLPPALGRGKNNIGSANIPFKAQQGGGCLVDSIITDAATGEYIIHLPPLRYEIPNFEIPSNRSIAFNNNALLDLSIVPPVQTAVDSVFRDSLGRKMFQRIDSAYFQTQRDFIFSTAPSIGVVGKEIDTLYGADTVIIDNRGVTVKVPTSAIPKSAIPHQIFVENENYTWNISAFEVYENRDSSNPGVLDSVPMVEGSIIIINNLSNDPRVEFDYELSDSARFTGTQEYTFQAGQANTTTDGTNPNNSFSKTCEITLLPKAGNAVSFQTNNDVFRGVIFGSRALGNTFSTAGPDVVTMILRDPPGTESSASWSAGETVTTISSWENGATFGGVFSKAISTGAEFTVGLGYETNTKLENKLNFNTSMELSVNGGGEYVESTTRTTTISTGDGEEFVGADADLFFGQAMNMDFGLSEKLTLVDTATCAFNDCVGGVISYNGVGYRLGLTNGFFTVPKGYETQFVYTQATIENSVIPKLIALRNNQLQNNPNFTSHLSSSDPNYGKSNDDPVFGNPTNNPEENDAKQDSIGTSYTFTGYRTIDTLITSKTKLIPKFPPVEGEFDTIVVPLIPPQMQRLILGVDSVWWYNRQIKLWEDVLAENEKEKALASDLKQNISYAGGSTFSESVTTTRSRSTTTTINYNLTEEMVLKIGAEIAGNGVEVENKLSLAYNHASSFGRSTDYETTFEYTLSDPDADDEFSVDVFNSPDGYGPIFKTRGGQTSCPYQGETKTKYYQPGIILDQATLQLERPRITASPSNLFNIPADGTGNITLNLINDGLSDNVYGLKVLEPSNPDGAILKIDGLGPNRSFPVPAKTSISKILTIQKGPTAIKYDSIALVFHSECQYAFGTANYEDIADTVYISVNFLPSCTDVQIQAPQNQFIANNSFKNTLPILISGYDINYGGLEKIALQYKPSNQASWVPLGTEWFKDTVDINSRYPNHPNPQLLPRTQSYLTYLLQMDQLIDQNYDLRAVSTCKIPFNPDFSQESTVISGIFDRVNPHAFGSPTPADGVLDPNDDISIQFNEDIEAGSLTPDNFQVTGVLNGAELRNDKAVNFDGATGYMEIANGFDFTSGDFTIEFWARRSTLGTEQYIISQGSSANNNFSILFNTNNKLELKAGNYNAISSFSITDTSNWHHYSIAYDRGNLAVEMVDRFASNSISSNNNNFVHAYQSGGKTFIGKDAYSGNNFLDASMHELRIWNRYLSNSQISSRIGIRLNGREAGLVGYWPMDEGRGTLAKDVARFRHAIMNAQWEINPKSTAIALDGISQYVSVDSAGTVAMTREMDLSIEFWFKTQGGQLQTMLSNGSGRFAFGDVNQNGWNLEMNAQNEIWVKNDSFAFKAVDRDYADNNWHHFALVVNRLSNATAYIDGIQQNSIASNNFNGFSGAKMVIGARYYLDGTLENVDQHFNGNIDEVRIWNKALIRDNIELNLFNRLNGEEFGLQAYYPFEDYRLELGVPILDAALSNQSKLGNQPSRLNASANGSTLFSTESPAIALQRPVEKVNFTWSVNGDRIVISSNDPPARIENVTLNVSVQGVRDLHGNIMQSPKTWIAFVNKNQVLWQDAEKNLTKEFNAPLSFTSQVINTGGDVKTFTISNIPAWLTASTTSGTINPLSTQTITFTVNPAVNIGDYAEDLLLTTDFGFNEKLLVNLKVRKTPPAFDFDPNLYSKSMNVIGQIEINGNISTNAEDILVAYINDEIRGKANLQYMPTLDRYMAFLDVYSNSSDSITFKVWNSAEGELHEDVTPNLYFVENSLVGSVLNPQIFKAVNNLAKPIVLNAGWNWVSFPLTDNKMKSLHTFFQGTNFSSGDVVKTIGNNAFAQYGGPSLGWSGGLTRDGLNNHQSYLIHIANRDTLMYSGLAIDPDTVPISITQGWNRIGFVSTKNVSINSALANYNATDGDLIKSQQAFAVYVTNLGWVGSLTTMESTEGYLLKAANPATFVYPRRGLLRIKEEPVQQKLEDVMPSLYTLNPNAFEASTNAIVKINTCEEVLANKDWALAAFKNNELRGFTNSTQFVDEELGYQYFMTVYGEGNETFTFKMINQESGEQMEVLAKLDFEKNKLQGEVTNPLQFNLFTEVDCDQFKVEEQIASEDEQLSYPNPFSKFVTIVVPNSITETGQVQIIDKNGRIVFNRDVEDARKFHLNGAELHFLTNGVYTLKFTDGETIVTEKLVRIK